MTYQSITIEDAIEAADGQVQIGSMPDGSFAVMVLDPQFQDEDRLGPFTREQALMMADQKKIEKALAIMGLSYDPVWGPQGRPKGGWMAYAKRVYKRAVAGRKP